jgi:hypothetical protein
MTLPIASRFALGLGVLSTISILLANLALLDIYHGESDVTLEWQVIRVSFLVMIAFHVFVLIAAWKASGLRPSRRT